MVRSDFVKRRDRQLLAELSAEDRELVHRATDNHPGATLANVIQMLKAFGI